MRTFLTSPGLLLGSALLPLFLSLPAKPLAGQAAELQCEPRSPLDVAVLVDPSTSVIRVDSGFRRQVSGWLDDLWQYLRPGDRVRVYSLPVAQGERTWKLADAHTGWPGTPDHVTGREQISRAARVIASSRPAGTDLTDGLEYLVASLEPPQAGGCRPLIIVLTDGSLAPYGRISRSEARQQFDTAVSRLHQRARVIALRIGPDTVRAFDGEKRNWIREPDGGESERLLASELLSTALGDENVLRWGEPISALVFGSSAFASQRGLRWVHGIEATSLPSTLNYLVYHATGADPLTSCVDRAHSQDGLDHFISRWGDEASCLHHLRGNVARVRARLQQLGIRDFAWTGANVVDTRHLPDTLRSIGQLVMSDKPNADCGLDSQGDLYDEPFPAFGRRTPRVSVEIRPATTSGAARTWVETVSLYRIGDTDCYAPDPGLPRLPPAVYEARALSIQLRLLRSAQEPSAPLQVTARLAHLPWQRLRRVRKLPFVTVDRWLVEGRIQIPYGAENAKVVFGEDARFSLDTAQEGCGQVVPGFTCAGFQKFTDSQPRLVGRLELHLDGSGAPVPFPFKKSELFSPFGTLSSPWFIAFVILVACFAALLLSWLRLTSIHSARARFRAIAAAESTYLYLHRMVAAALLLILIRETVLWAQADEEPFLFREFLAATAVWVGAMLLSWPWRDLARRFAGIARVIGEHLDTSPDRPFASTAKR